MPFTTIKGNLFDAAAPALLAHACNCVGLWGAGVAAAFKKLYPDAYATHRKHCQAHSAEQLLGTALVIPPSPREPPNYVVCLFTSGGYGTAKHNPTDIVRHTRLAMDDLQRQLEADPRWCTLLGVETVAQVEVHMPMINAGLFAVPWDQTAAVLDASALRSVVHVL